MLAQATPSGLEMPPAASQLSGTLPAPEELAFSEKMLKDFYKGDFLLFSERQQNILRQISQAAVKTGLYEPAFPSKQNLEDSPGEYENLIEVHGDFSAAILNMLQEEPPCQWRSLDTYIQALKNQGGITIASTLAATPFGWIERDSARLVEMRAHFGVCCEPIFKELRRLHPKGWNQELEELSQIIGISGLGLIVQEKQNALACVRDNQSVLRQLEQLCENIGRADAFIGATVFLKDRLLREQGERLIETALINPNKLPDIVEKLDPEMLQNVPHLVAAIVRHARTHLAPAIQLLRLVKEQEHDFVEKLVMTSGIHSSQAIAFRAPGLLASDPARHFDLLNQFGHAYWGLASQFRNNLHREIESHRQFIDRIIELTGTGAGQFFASVPHTIWNQETLDFAARYGTAAAFIARQRGRNFLSFEGSPSYQELLQANREMFNISWVNRYSRVNNEVLALDLLENNLRNMASSPDDDRSLTLFISAKTDPLNTFGSHSYYRLLREIGLRSRLFIGEAENNEQVTDLQRKVCTDPRYGGSPDKPRRIDFLILAAHSDGDVLQWSGGRHAPPASQGEVIYSPEQLLSASDAHVIHSWNEFLALQNHVLLMACSTFRRTGALETIGPVFERNLPGSSVYGMRFPGNLADLVLDERGMPIRLYWRDGYTWY